MSLKSSLFDRVVALRNSVLILPVLVIFLSSSCVKDPSLIGIGLVPPGDKIQTIYTDTISVYSSILKLDKVTASGIVDFIFGSYKDPVFGLSSAKAITEFSFFFGGVVYGPKPVTDSVVMNIKYKYKYIYGNKNSTLNFKVYRLSPELFFKRGTSRLRDTLSFYSDFDVQPFLGDQIGQFSFTPASHANDSIITFKLDPSYGDSLIQDTVKFTKDKKYYWTAYDSAFYYHKRINGGIAIIPDNASSPGDGFIFKTYYNGDYIWINVYFKSDDTTFTNHPGTNGVSHFGIATGNRDIRVNTYTHDYTSSTFLASLNNPTISDTFGYIASMSGVMTKLSFPGLDKLKTKPSDIISINRAELIIPVYPGDTAHYPPSEMIQLMHKGSSNEYEVLPDYTYFSAYSSYLDGNYDMYNRIYSTLITKHVEFCLTHKDYGKDLFVRSTTSSSSAYPQYTFAGRSILRNGTGKNKIKLKITYTKR